MGRYQLWIENFDYGFHNKDAIMRIVSEQITRVTRVKGTVNIIVSKVL